MKVYELMHLLGTCPAGAEIHVSKGLGRDNLADLVKECDDDCVEVGGTVIDFDKRTVVTKDDTVELYLD